MRIVWTAPAARDLEAIGDYIARHNRVAAHRTVQRIRAMLDTLDRPMILQCSQTDAPPPQRRPLPLLDRPAR
jgi:plasmid stabilization system protein ParE